jgi:hypothetical protein
VTSGIDFARLIVARLAGENVARTIQLVIEYDPDPPFDSGHPDRAPGGSSATSLRVAGKDADGLAKPGHDGKSHAHRDMALSPCQRDAKCQIGRIQRRHVLLDEGRKLSSLDREQPGVNVVQKGIERRGLMAMLAGVLVMATRPSLADDAIDPEAKDAVTRMGKTLSAGAFSFQSNTIRQYEKDNVPLHIFHSAQVLVRRPDRLMVGINGDDGQARIGYDGKMLTVYSVTANKYGQMPITGSIETMFRAASERMGVDFPLADLLADQPGQAFLNGVASGKKVGAVTIDGQKCNHFFFLQPPGIELELWSEADERALPRRIAITYRSIPGEPQFLSEMSDWKLGINPPDSAFEVKIPAGATRIEGTEKSQ